MTYAAQHTSQALLMQELEDLQARTHAWGNRNQVTFDPSKEHFKIIEYTRPGPTGTTSKCLAHLWIAS